MNRFIYFSYMIVEIEVNNFTPFYFGILKDIEFMELQNQFFHYISLKLKSKENV